MVRRYVLQLPAVRTVPFISAKFIIAHRGDGPQKPRGAGPRATTEGLGPKSRGEHGPD